MKDVVHRSETVLLIIDMLNTFDFHEGHKLLKHALPVAGKILKLKQRAKVKKIPVLYINDNFDQWRSDWIAIYEKCKVGKGQKIANLLKPQDDDYFVIKPKYSAFYSTSLAVLLEQMGARKLIITGIATDICILFSVHDAHIHGYEIVVPNDCTAAEVSSHKKSALALMQKVFAIKSPKSTTIRFR